MNRRANIPTQLRKFCSAQCGSVITEFALLAPIVIGFMFLSVVGFDAARGLRQITTASVVVSDIASRFDFMDADREGEVLATAAALLGRYADRNDYNVTVSSIANEAGDNVDDLEVVWSFAKNPGTELATGALQDLNIPTINEGSSVIFVNIELDYTPPFNVSGGNDMIALKDSSIRRPRFVNEVCYKQPGQATICSNNN